MKRIKLFLIAITSIVFLSNDTVIKSNGESIFPIQETDIRITNEVLKLKLHKRMNVSVNFEFFNPTNEKEVFVGFVTPPTHEPGDEDDSTNIENRMPEISDFSVVMNGEKLDYKVSVLKDTEFEKVKNQDNLYNYIYYFKAHFKKGKNTIVHNYEYTGGFSSNGDVFYDYVLTTGKNWANNQIDNFHLIIDLGENIEFQINNSELEKNTNNWVINGKGKTQRLREILKVFIRKGTLEYKKTNFKPDNEVLIVIPNEYNYYEINSIEYLAHMGNKDTFESLDKEKLRLVRNYYFAKAGFKFESEDLVEFYSKYFWYLPEDNLSSKEIFDRFDKKTKEKILLITEIENNK